jgi:anhydro-N-acetylmuramic acid kinase
VNRNYAIVNGLKNIKPETSNPGFLNREILLLANLIKFSFMVYRAIGLMSGSSLDGLDIVFAEFHENGGKWTYEIKEADCYSYTKEWIASLKNAGSLTALDYQLLHASYGHFLGEQVNRFIEEKRLQYQVALVASHGHTVFHLPAKRMTAQLGDGAAIAAETKLPVVSDLRSLDVAFGGQGAPIVPVGEKLLLNEYDFFLNLGGIANISARSINGEGSSQPAEGYIAFDVCPANRVLNMLANDAVMEYDDEGSIAASGKIDTQLLQALNVLEYYQLDYPKSLANDFGTEIVYPMIKNAGVRTDNALRTYTEHIVIQIKNAIANLKKLNRGSGTGLASKLLVTGGGAFNTFLVQRLTEQLKELKTEIIIPDKKLVKFKEALIMALIGVLRWREKANVFSSVTGADRDSIGGALWMGQEE